VELVSLAVFLVLFLVSFFRFSTQFDQLEINLYSTKVYRVCWIIHPSEGFKRKITQPNKTYTTSPKPKNPQQQKAVKNNENRNHSNHPRSHSP
jgi:hypothetical protein